MVDTDACLKIDNLLGLQDAKNIGDEFLALEKYVNLNYLVSCNFTGQHNRFVESSTHGGIHMEQPPRKLIFPVGMQGFHKAVKKHDKMLPLAPCQQFYMHVLRNQPWVQVSALTPSRKGVAPLKQHY